MWQLCPSAVPGCGSIRPMDTRTRLVHPVHAKDPRQGSASRSGTRQSLVDRQHLPVSSGWKPWLMSVAQVGLSQFCLDAHGFWRPLVAVRQKLNTGSPWTGLNGSGRSNEFFSSFRLSLRALAKPETMAQGWWVKGMPRAISRSRFTATSDSDPSHQPRCHPSTWVDGSLKMPGPQHSDKPSPLKLNIHPVID